MGQQKVALNSDYFFCGTLRHLPLLGIVLGRDVQGEAAVLPGAALYWSNDGSFPVIVAEPGAVAEGLVVRTLSEVDVARLDFFEGGFGFQARPRQVLLSDGQMLQAMVFGPTPDESEPGKATPWLLADWQARYAAEFEATARDYLAQFGVRPPRAVAARFAQMMVRGASRVRATETAPTQLRHHAQATDVDLAALREPYARFFAMEEFDLSFRRFDGSMSPKVTRAVFVACDAVTVLPYDPARDRVLVIDQFRTGPYARGDRQPWQIEVIAGRIDAGETPEAAALREAEEEAGLHLDTLLPVARYYPSPGCSSEFIYSFVALTDLPDDAAGVFGIAGEAEDIRGHLLSFDELMALVVSGEISNAPTLLTTYWLAQHRKDLRGT